MQGQLARKHRRDIHRTRDQPIRQGRGLLRTQSQGLQLGRAQLLRARDRAIDGTDDHRVRLRRGLAPEPVVAHQADLAAADVDGLRRVPAARRRDARIQDVDERRRRGPQQMAGQQIAEQRPPLRHRPVDEHVHLPTAPGDRDGADALVARSFRHARIGQQRRMQITEIGPRNRRAVRPLRPRPDAVADARVARAGVRGVGFGGLGRDGGCGGVGAPDATVAIVGAVIAIAIAAIAAVAAAITAGATTARVLVRNGRVDGHDLRALQQIGAHPPARRVLRIGLEGAGQRQLRHQIRHRRRIGDQVRVEPLAEGVDAHLDPLERLLRAHRIVAPRLFLPHRRRVARVGHAPGQQNRRRDAPEQSIAAAAILAFEHGDQPTSRAAHRPPAKGAAGGTRRFRKRRRPGRTATCPGCGPSRGNGRDCARWR